ncbi:MAG: MBOAT family protein [Ruminococcus sp.]|nr:MBOAT family protein [Ruminococcus sp.]
MVFSSTVFLFIFFPIVYILYTIIPNIKAKNVLLIFVSLLFYAFGEPKAIALMIFSIVINYILSILLVRFEKLSKMFLILGIVIDLGILCVFKYLGFIAETISNLFQISVPEVNIALPIGISFFTFQAMSYLIDVYKDRSLVQKNILNIALYISFFPQLIAGPIIKYYDMEYQINNRSITLDNTIQGLRRIICGLAKKLLIANTIGIVVDDVFALNNTNMNILTAWIGAVSYALQIYFDFSGYSDMAIGLSRVFGFKFKENFNYPYSSLSMKDFWNRWHISVSSWFKEYLYFPLGGNRKGSARTNINKIIVFFCTGLWHGANLTFILWGLMHGTLLMLEYYNIIPISKIKNNLIKHIYVIICFTITFVVFRADTVSQGLFFIKQMFTGFNFDSNTLSYTLELLTPSFVITFILGCILSMPVKDAFKNLMEKHNKQNIVSYASYGISLILLFMCIVNLSLANYNPFIYNNF